MLRHLWYSLSHIRALVESWITYLTDFEKRELLGSKWDRLMCVVNITLQAVFITRLTRLVEQGQDKLPSAVDGNDPDNVLAVLRES